MVGYIEQMVDDILDYIKNEGIEVSEENRDEVSEQLNDQLWTEDSVTGNASGSYYCNSSKAKEQVVEDGFNYIADMVQEFGLDAGTVTKHFVNEDWEWWDVSIRCYLLGQAIEIAIDDIIH